MVKNEKTSLRRSGKLVIGIVLFSLVAGGLLPLFNSVEGAQFSPKSATAYHDEAFSREAKWARVGETLHLRAVNSSSSSAPAAGDYLYLYVNSTSNSTGFVLNLTYSSDYYFTCNLTLGNTTNSTAGNYTIEVSHGGAVYIRDNTNRSEVYYTIKIDNEPPTLDVDVEGRGFTDHQRIYLMQGDRITLSPRDTTSGIYSTMYRWDGGGYTEYNQSGGITPPVTQGRHILQIRLEDNATNVALFNYTAWVSINWTAGKTVLANETLSYTNSTIFAGNITVMGTLTLRNCNLIFTGLKKKLEVYRGGFFGITDYDGNPSTTSDNSRILPSPGSSYTISYLMGSDGWINSTEILNAGVNGKAIYIASHVDLTHVSATLMGGVVVDGSRVRIESSSLEVRGAGEGLLYQGHHRTFSSPVYLGNTTLKGSAPSGVLMKNLSVERVSSTIRYSGYASGENRTISYVNTFGSSDTLRFSYIFPQPDGASGALIASSNLINWVTLYNITPTTEWRVVDLNMSSYASQNMELRFYFNAPENYTGSGYYITDPVIITPDSGMGIIPYSSNFTDVSSSLMACHINNVSISLGNTVGASFKSAYAVRADGLHVDGAASEAVELLNLTKGDVHVRNSNLRGSADHTLYGVTVIGDPSSTFNLERTTISRVNMSRGYLVRIFGGDVKIDTSVLNNSHRGLLLMDGALRLIGSSIYNLSGEGVIISCPSSDYRPQGRLPVEIVGTAFSNVASYGIVAVGAPYAEGGGVRINNTLVANIPRGGGEAVKIWVDPSITDFRTVVEDLTVTDSGDALNISSPVGASMKGVTVRNSSGFAVTLGGGGVFNLSRLSANGISSWSLHLSDASTLNLDGGNIINTGEGLILDPFTESHISSLTLNGSRGDGIWAGASAELELESTTITNCDSTGVDTEKNVKVDFRQVWVSFSGKGIRLNDPRIEGLQGIRTTNNMGDGLHLIVGDNLYSYLGGGTINMVDSIHSTNNDGYGVRVVRGGSSQFQLTLKNFTLYGNLLPDLMVDEGVRVHLLPITASFDGATMQFNGNLRVRDTVYLMVRGLTLNFVGDDCGVVVESGGFLNLQGAAIRSATGETYSFEVYGGGAITDSYLGDLYLLYVSGSDTFIVRSSRIEGSEVGLRILRSSFTVERTTVSGSDRGIDIIASTGTISDSYVRSSFVGISLKDIAGEVSVERTLVEDNVYGIRAENAGENFINISRCTFAMNEVSDIMVRGATITVFFSAIDEEKISVLDTTSKVYIFYGLDLYLYDEVGDPLTASVDITDSGGASRYSSPSVEGQALDIPLLAYTVTSSGPSSSHQPYTVTVTAPTGESTMEVFTITGHTVLGVTLNGAPTLVGSIPTLHMKEDTPAPHILNLMNYVQDRDRLTFTVTGGTHIGAEVDEEGMLSLYPLTENWFGTESISVRAEDTFGAYVEFIVTVVCEPVNDPPVYRNLTITPRYPVTGDTLSATMEYYDVDGDPEPETILIQWYRNGEVVPRYSNQLQVPDVKAGEHWYFEVRAWDGKSASENGYGELYRSEEVVVGNHPPVINRVSILEESPTTEMDLHVVVEDFYDPDSPMVEFHVQWQYLDNDDWVTLPVMGDTLPSIYTRRGLTIRALVSGFDGTSWSEARATEEVTIRNTLPSVLEARFEPEEVFQNTPRVTARVVESYDPDGDYIDYYFTWLINGREVQSGYGNATLVRNTASFTSGDVITCEIRPSDTYGAGEKYTLEVTVKPIDTDGDGLYDDYNGNGRNDGADDTDDDNDGYLDEWEEFMGTDPKDPSSKPVDTDGDGLPDGDSSNSQSWMDTDDDNDGFPDSRDDFPRLATEWKDTDGDGVGDNSDPDIDGDGVPNWKDYDAHDPTVWKAPVKKESKAFEYAIITLLLLILLFMILGAYLLYTGRIKFPVKGEVKTLGAPGAPQPFMGAPEEVEFEEEELGYEEEEEEGEEFEELEELVECGMCHELIPADSKVCPNCGAKLVED